VNPARDAVRAALATSGVGALARAVERATGSRAEPLSELKPNFIVKICCQPERASFVVLTGANMPAVLSEISFVSNASDETLLLQSAQRQCVAEGLFRGITAYLDNLHSLPPGGRKICQ
jgi:N-acetylmuramoyl-L-alanine amidase